MRRYPGLDRTLLALFLLVPLLGACASKSARFYTLDPVARTSVPGPAESVSPPGSSSTIGIVSVEIPDYLDRPQIVTRDDRNRLKLAEFDRWGGELQKDIARVLAETMSARLAGSNVFVTTGRRAMLARYRVAVHVTRFDPMPGSVVRLDALWTVLPRDGADEATRGDSSLAEPVEGTGYGAVVAAMSRAIDRLGTEIAGAVKPMLAEGARPKTAETGR